MYFAGVVTSAQHAQKVVRIVQMISFIFHYQMSLDLVCSAICDIIVGCLLEDLG